MTYLKKMSICFFLLITNLVCAMKPDDMFKEIGGVDKKVPIPLVSCAKLASEQKFDDAASLLNDFKNVFAILNIQTLQQFPNSKEDIRKKLSEHYNKVKRNYNLEESPYDKEFSIKDFVYYTLLGEFYWDYNNNLLTIYDSLESTKKQTVGSVIRIMFCIP